MRRQLEAGEIFGAARRRGAMKIIRVRINAVDDLDGFSYTRLSEAALWLSLSAGS